MIIIVDVQDNIIIIVDVILVYIQFNHSAG